MSEAMDSECMPSAPVEEHEHFAQFVGTWKAEVSMWMGPGEPMESTGMMVNSLDLGGRYLKQDYKGDATEGPFPNFEGRGFWGFNDVTRKFEGFWIDNASNQMSVERGEYSAATKSWTMLGEMAMPGGGAVQKRSVITVLGEDEHTMEMFMTGPDGQEGKVMHIHYSRAQGLD